MKRLALLALAAGSALAASAAAPDFRAPPLGSAGLATNHIMTWAGYTLGGQKNGYNDHTYIELPGNQNDLTVCSWVAVLDADGAGRRPDGQAGGSRRASSVLPALYYSPNVERSAPDLLGGAWGWGGAPVAVSGSLSFDYGFPAALPAGCRLVEYVESTGAQYVNTGVNIVPATLSFVYVFENLATDTTWRGLVGARNGSTAYGAQAYNVFARKGSVRLDVTGRSVTVSTSGTNTLSYTPGTTTFNGVEYPNESKSDLNAYFLLFSFGRNQNDDGGFYSTACPQKVFSCSIATNGVLVRDYLPVKDANGVAGLWDRVSGQIYYSETSTPLVAGPEREPTPEERCHTLAWNGGETGTNCFPRGVYTVAWTNLSSTMTLSVGGESVSLDAPAGVRNVLPGSGMGFTLSGSGTAQVGISRRKVEPFFKTDAGAVGGGDGAMQAYDAALVSSNFCFVAHRVHLDASTHTNEITIVQQDGSRASWGASPELPPDGCGSLRTNGLYQLVYSAYGDLKASYVYEWDRRQFAAWLADGDLAAIYEDGARIRLAHGYPPAVCTNSVYQPDP